MGKIKIFLVVLIVLLFAANYEDIAAKFSTKMNFDHSSFGIDTVDPETEDEMHLGKNNLEEENAYYLEPDISLKERIFCRGGAGKAASCTERPINPYWESWTYHFGSPDRDESVAKQKYEEKYKGYQKTKRAKRGE